MLKNVKSNRIIFIILISIIILIVLMFAIYNIKIKDIKLNTISNLTNSFEYNFNDNDMLLANLRVPKFVNASVPIFMYHFVRDDTGDYEYPENMMRPETLKAQLQYLKDNGYETIYKDDIAHLENFTKPVWLTFDDGWEDFYLYAYPLFKEYNMKASYYVITDLIGTPGYVKLEQLKEMKESGLIDIQSHTVTHPRLATLSSDEIYNELYNSKKYLKDNLDIDSEVICYPYGSFNNTVLNLSKEVGYKYGLAMDGGVYHTSIHKNIYSIPRIYANRSMSMTTFINYVKNSKVEVIWE